MKEHEAILDPVAFFWRQFSMLEEGWAKTWELMLADEAYSKGMGHFMDLYLSNQQVVNRSLHDFTEKMNLPNKQDLASVASQVTQTEQKVITLLNGLELVQQMQNQLLELMQEQMKKQAPQSEQQPPEQTPQPTKQRQQQPDQIQQIHQQPEQIQQPPEQIQQPPQEQTQEQTQLQLPDGSLPDEIQGQKHQQVQVHEQAEAGEPKGHKASRKKAKE